MNQSYTIEHKGRLYYLKVDGKQVFKAHNLECVTDKLQDLEASNHPSIQTFNFNLEIKSSLPLSELKKIVPPQADNIKESLEEHFDWEFDAPTNYVSVTIS